MYKLKENFIVFEGIDQIGKTLVAKEVCRRTNHCYLKFPNIENETGRIIREILQGKRVYEPHSFQALNALDKQLTCVDGKVIADRYDLSQKIYGKAEGISEEFLNEICLGLPKPDITFVFTGTPFYKDDEIFSEKTKLIGELYEEYLEKERFNNRVIRINANKPFEKTVTEIIEYIWIFER